MKINSVKFSIQGSNVKVSGYPELENRKGTIVGDGIAFFFGEGWRNYELYVANTLTGKIRKLSTADGEMASEMQRPRLYAMLDSIDGMVLRMGFVPFLGRFILTDDISPMKMVMGWKTMMKRKYMQLLIPT